jgi:hypothetical protein
VFFLDFSFSIQNILNFCIEFWNQLKQTLPASASDGVGPSNLQQKIKFNFYSLLEENLQLFRAENKMNEEVWPEYIRYCDDIVHKNLLHTVGVSMAYLADNMDPQNNFPALFESRLELEIPNLIFIPSLDPQDENSFNHLLINLVNGKRQQI